MGKIIGLLVVVGGFLGWRHWSRLPSNQAKRKFAFQAIVGALLITVILLAIAGRIHPLGAVFAVLIPLIKVCLNLLIRAFPLIAQIYGANYAKPRSLSASIIEIQINFANGNVSGRVLEGDFRGKNLSDFTDNELEQLRQYCQQNDKKSAYLLQLYTAFRFKEQFGKQSENANRNTSSGDLSTAEAAEILGVNDNASEDDVLRAHRQLINKVHPDKGGNNYLASLLNRARDTLLR